MIRNLNLKFRDSNKSKIFLTRIKNNNELLFKKLYAETINFNNFLTFTLNENTISDKKKIILNNNEINNLFNFSNNQDNQNLHSTFIMNKKEYNNHTRKINYSILNSTNKTIYKGIQISKKNFALYIPYKKLIFVKHAKHGNVYPVYMADTEHYRKSNPNKIFPLLAFFTSINLFICLTGFQIIPVTKLYEFLFLSDVTVFFSVLFNVFLVKKYIDFLVKYKNRVKNLFLLPCGTKIIIESFDSTESNVEIQDIFERRVYLRYDSTQKNSVFTNNENSFRGNIGWGFNKENFFEGKRKFLDYEILYQLINRINIDTTQIKFKPSQVSLNFLSPEEKRSIINKFSGRKILDIFNFKYLKMNYYYMKKKIYVDNIVFIRNLKRKKSKEILNQKNKVKSLISDDDKEKAIQLNINREKRKIKILSFYD